MEHAVTVHLRLTGGPFGSPEEDDAVAALGDELERAVEAASAGEFDGEEVGEHKCVLFMYGPDADRLFTAIEPVLKDTPLAAGGYAIKRHGEAADPDAAEVRVTW
jgi:hypothetical protein